MSDYETDFNFLSFEDLAQVAEAVKDGRTFNTRNKKGQTHLHMAVAGAVEWVDACLLAQINPNAHDLCGQTPLHEAVLVGVVDVVSKLLEAGARPNAQNEDGETPLHVAAAAEVLAAKMIVAKLLDAGADPKVRNKDGKIAWDLAQKNEHLQGTDAYCKRRAQQQKENA